MLSITCLLPADTRSSWPWVQLTLHRRRTARPAELSGEARMHLLSAGEVLGGGYVHARGPRGRRGREDVASAAATRERTELAWQAARHAVSERSGGTPDAPGMPLQPAHLPPGRRRCTCQSMPAALPSQGSDPHAAPRSQAAAEHLLRAAVGVVRRLVWAGRGRRRRCSSASSSQGLPAGRPWPRLA